jgi:hypothetical protein
LFNIINEKKRIFIRKIFNYINQVLDDAKKVQGIFLLKFLNLVQRTQKSITKAIITKFPSNKIIFIKAFLKKKFENFHISTKSRRENLLSNEEKQNSKRQKEI